MNERGAHTSNQQIYGTLGDFLASISSTSDELPGCRCPTGSDRARKVDFHQVVVYREAEALRSLFGVLEQSVGLDSREDETIGYNISKLQNLMCQFRVHLWHC